MLYSSLAFVVGAAFTANATGGGLWALGFVMGYGLGVVAMALAFTVRRNS